MKEETLLFGKFQSLVGVLTAPEHRNDAPAIILLNAGLIHHVGPNRLYVKLARYMAQLGFPVLRFDLSGIGDSKVRPDNLPFEKSNIDDTQQAMDMLQETRGINQFILIGHCAGAINSFRTAITDERVIGVVLINPEGGDSEWDSYDLKRKTSRYYQNYYTRRKLFDPASWKKLLQGQANYRSIVRNIFQNIIWNQISTQAFKIKNMMGASRADLPNRVRDAILQSFETLAERNTEILMVYSEASTGLERIQAMVGKELKALNRAGKVRLNIIPASDHTFTLVRTQNALFNVLEMWSKSLTGQRTQEGT
jgi:pimeloyl-ACP methyl ester carboxylesterase